MIESKRTLVIAFIIFILMLSTLIFMSNAINDSENFGKLYSLLLVTNAIGLLILVYLIGRNIRHLLKQLKEKRPGSRLTLRMVATFILLAIIPLLIVYFFSTDFIRRGIDNWFDVRIEAALTDSLDLSKEAISLRMRELLKTTEQIAVDLTESDQSDINLTSLHLENLQNEIISPILNTSDLLDTSKLDDFRIRHGAEELAILTRKGRVLATSSTQTDIIPHTPGESTLLQLRQGRNYIGLEPIRDAGLFIRALVKIPNNNLDNKTRMLQALYPISSHINELAENVQGAYAKYQELAYLRKPLQLSFNMTLTLVLLFSILSSVLAAFHFARKLTSPIQDLAEGTRRIAQGDYGKQLVVSSSDDLGFLVQSFNVMSKKIAAAQHELDTQRTYLQTVLGKLSSGVLTFDADLNLRTANASANQILDTNLVPYLGGSLNEVPESETKLAALFESIEPKLVLQSDDWQKQVVLFGAAGRQVLMCRGTALDIADEEGHVIVFDDVTALIQGQKDAAWSEVARRLAHEIKNPLTPIQLSAERLRHKYLSKMEGSDAETLDRLTNTIVQQVGTMKDMVNTFSDYARPSQIKTEPLNVNPMIEEVSTLYQQMNTEVEVKLNLDEKLPLIEADHNRLRQLLNNLIKNAIEATEELDKPEVKIQTKTIHSAGKELIEIRIIDNGSGFPDDLIGEIFEPYVTTKARGTGLGLAIVKKIVEEHGGIVWVDNNKKQGGRVVIRLPLLMENQNVEPNNIESSNIHSIEKARNKSI